MKHIKESLIFFVLLSCFVSYVSGQEKDSTILPVPFDPEIEKIVYQEVVQEEGTKLEFFYRAVNWLNNTYSNPVAVTSVRDPNTGKIVGNYRFRVYQDAEEEEDVRKWETILYSFTLEFREGRYRYTFDNFLLKTRSRYPIENWLQELEEGDPSYWSDKLKKFDEHIQGLINSLKESMKAEEVIEEESW